METKIPDLNATIPRNTLVFRPARDLVELEGLLRLRHRIYSQTPGMCRLIDPDQEFEIDGFDRNSTHFGLFVDEGGASRAVGSLRVTESARCPMADLVEDLASQQPQFCTRAFAPLDGPFPTLAYLEGSSELQAMIQSLLARGHRLAEPGRLVVDQAFNRGSRRAGVRLAGLMIESAFAWAWSIRRLDSVLMSCDLRLESLYRAYGFERMFEPRFQPRTGVTMSLLRATPESVPEGLRPRVKDATRQFRKWEEVRYRIPQLRDAARPMWCPEAATNAA